MSNSRFEATVHCVFDSPYILETTNISKIKQAGGSDNPSCWGDEKECRGYASSALIYTDGGSIEGIYCSVCKEKRIKCLMEEASK